MTVTQWTREWETWGTDWGRAGPLSQGGLGETTPLRAALSAVAACLYEPATRSDAQRESLLRTGEACPTKDVVPM